MSDSAKIDLDVNNFIREGAKIAQDAIIAGNNEAFSNVTNDMIDISKFNSNIDLQKKLSEIIINACFILENNKNVAILKSSKRNWRQKLAEDFYNDIINLCKNLLN